MQEEYKGKNTLTVVAVIILVLGIIGGAAYYGLVIGQKGSGAPTGIVEITPIPTNPSNDPATLLIENEMKDGVQNNPEPETEQVESSEVIAE